MTARELFSHITRHCEEIYSEIQRLNDESTPYEEYLSSLCEQAMQAYFWEDQEKLDNLLHETQAFAARLQSLVGQGNSYALVA
jgi:hypothetical protein